MQSKLVKKNKVQKMNRSESKYFNTALLMDQALLVLLEKKDIEFITVKEVCQKAGVNRSTFYLHYENIYDLLTETIEMLGKEFTSSFEHKEMLKKLQNGKKEDLFFIKEEYLTPYLQFVKNNLRAFRIIHKKPNIFNIDSVYKKMYKDVFYPIISKFSGAEDEKQYVFEFFTKGVVGIISQWINNDCREPIEKIVEIIVGCVGNPLSDKK